ncbi:MAG: hypothetical protein ACO3CN_05855 [Candidatus Nanopelagicales bacterium]|jgi:hypothetical protein
MATEFNWGVAQLERQLSDGTVYTVHYTIEAFDGTYRSSAYGSLGLEAPDEDEMIPYADLTPEIVVGWVKEKFGEEKVDEIEAALQAQIDQQKAPTTGTGLPWNS